MDGIDVTSIGSFAQHHAYSLALLGVFLLVGYSAIRLPGLRLLLLPGSLVAGLLLLLCGPYIAGVYAPGLQIPAEYYRDWSVLPGLLINVVFACLFLARPILPFRRMWRNAGPQVAFGQTLAWGQYVVGGVLTMLVLVPVFGLPPLSAALIEIGFEGGHGTAAGLGPVFNELGFSDGQELAIGLATTGLIAALVSGTVLIHWARRRHRIPQVVRPSPRDVAFHYQVLRDLRDKGVQVRNHITSGALFSHLALLAVSIGTAWIIHQGLIALDGFFSYVPLFTICLFGGMIGRSIWKWLGLTVLRPLVELLSAVALSVLIATAIGSVALTPITDHWAAFLLLTLAGVAWVLFAFLVVAPRIFQRHWFERGVIDMGQSMGMTATGLLFLHMVDPKDRTSSLESFGYKQLLFEPFVGGGFVTALSMPLIYTFGLPVFLAGSFVIFTVWLLVGLRYFGRAGASRRGLGSRMWHGVADKVRL